MYPTDGSGSVHLSWGGAFHDAGSGIASYHVCVGPTLGDCSVHDELLDSTEPYLPTQTRVRDWELSQYQANAAAAGRTSTVLVASIKATDGVGLSTAASENIVLDWTAPTGLDRVLVNGRQPNGVETLYSVEPTIELSLPSPEDDDSGEVDIAWAVAVTGVHTDAPLLSAECMVQASTASAALNPINSSGPSPLIAKFTAHCSGLIDVNARVCFQVLASNLAGASTQLPPACIVVFGEMPSFPVQPSLARLDLGSAYSNGTAADERFQLTWQRPYMAIADSQLLLSYVLCTLNRCATPTPIISSQTSVYIPFSHPMLAGYRGMVWAYLQGKTDFGLDFHSERTNVVVAGRGVPSAGSVRLSESIELIDVEPASLTHPNAAVLTVSGFVEPILGIDSVKVCVGTRPGGSDILPCQMIGGMPSSRRIDLSAYADQIPDLTTVVALLEASDAADHGLYATVEACTRLGDCASAISNRGTIDREDPSIGQVSDGLLLKSLDDVVAWEAVEYVDCRGLIGGSQYPISSPPPTAQSEPIGGPSAPPPLAPPMSPPGAPAGKPACLRGPLINPANAAVSAATIAMLRPLARLDATTAVVDSLAGTRLGVSWSAITDSGSGVASAELCMDTREFRCFSISMGGGSIVLLLPEVSTGDVVVATVCATDNAGRRSCSSSPGARVFTSTPMLEAIKVPSYVPSCSSISLELQLPPPRTLCAGFQFSMQL